MNQIPPFFVIINLHHLFVFLIISSALYLKTETPLCLDKSFDKMLFHFMKAEQAVEGEHIYRWKQFQIKPAIVIGNDRDPLKRSVVTLSDYQNLCVVPLGRFQGNSILRQALYNQGGDPLHRIKISGTSFAERRLDNEEIVRNARLLLYVSNFDPHLFKQLVGEKPNDFAFLCSTVPHQTWRDRLSANGNFQRLACDVEKVFQQTETSEDNDPQQCRICFDRECTIVFDCGHLACEQCSQSLETCPFCRHDISEKIRLYWS